MRTRGVEPRDVVLAIVAFNTEEKVEGRTFLQKLAYFLNEKLSLGIEFEPHFYGPYSESLAMATNTLVALGFLDETEERFLPVSADVFEPRRYTYKHTQAGKKVLRELQRQNSTWLNRVKKTMDEITAKEECNYECLSLAAKMFHILKRQGKAMTESELSAAANDLGWKLRNEQIQKAAKFLKELRLIREVP